MLFIRCRYNNNSNDSFCFDDYPSQCFQTVEVHFFGTYVCHVGEAFSRKFQKFSAACLTCIDSIIRISPPQHFKCAFPLLCLISPATVWCSDWKSFKNKRHMLSPSRHAPFLKSSSIYSLFFFFESFEWISRLDVWELNREISYFSYVGDNKK